MKTRCIAQAIRDKMAADPKFAEEIRKAQEELRQDDEEDRAAIQAEIIYFEHMIEELGPDGE